MNAKILIAEDSAYIRTILKEVLLRSGYDVVGEAENGREAVALYSRLNPDVIAMDITMPDMDGIEALKAIKDEHADARIVMIGAMGQQDEVIEALRSGAADFFIKPFQAERVAEAIERALNNTMEVRTTNGR